MATEQELAELRKELSKERAAKLQFLQQQQQQQQQQQHPQIKAEKRHRDVITSEPSLTPYPHSFDPFLFRTETSNDKYDRTSHVICQLMSPVGGPLLALLHPTPSTWRTSGTAGTSNTPALPFSHGIFYSFFLLNHFLSHETNFFPLKSNIWVCFFFHFCLKEWKLASNFFFLICNNEFACWNCSRKFNPNFFFEQ